MCGPAAIPLAIAATAVTAIGQGVGAAQQAATYRYQANVAAQNARLVSEQSRMAMENSQYDRERLGRKIGQTQGAQTAAMAANGVDIGFGSALHVAEDTAMLGAEDYAQLDRQTAQNQRGYDINWANYLADEQAKKQAASGAAVKGIFDVASTVLGGASQVSKLKAASA